MIKLFKKLDIKETYINILKAIHDKTTIIITFNSEKLKGFL